jgi:hypothetical protein
MTAEHMDILVLKCSKFTSVEMPEFPQPHSPSKDTDINVPTSVTPTYSDRNVPTTGPTDGPTTVTPHSNSRNFSGIDGRSRDNDEKSKPTDKPKDVKAPVKLSKEMMETHRKWQEAAEAIGGPGSRIIVRKPEAKKLIYEILYDAFQPMNITQIYQVGSLHKDVCYWYWSNFLVLSVSLETQGCCSKCSFKSLPRRNGARQVLVRSICR